MTTQPFLRDGGEDTAPSRPVEIFVAPRFFGVRIARSRFLPRCHQLVSVVSVGVASCRPGSYENLSNSRMQISLREVDSWQLGLCLTSRAVSHYRSGARTSTLAVFQRNNRLSAPLVMAILLLPGRYREDCREEPRRRSRSQADRSIDDIPANSTGLRCGWPQREPGCWRAQSPPRTNGMTTLI